MCFSDRINRTEINWNTAFFPDRIIITQFDNNFLSYNWPSLITGADAIFFNALNMCLSEHNNQIFSNPLPIREQGAVGNEGTRAVNICQKKKQVSPVRGWFPCPPPNLQLTSTYWIHLVIIAWVSAAGANEAAIMREKIDSSMNCFQVY